MMDDYYTHRRHDRNYMRLNDREIDPQGHATDLFTDWAIEYLASQERAKPEPFFLYLAYNAPHDPIQPPPDWLERVEPTRAGHQREAGEAGGTDRAHGRGSGSRNGGIEGRRPARKHPGGIRQRQRGRIGNRRQLRTSTRRKGPDVRRRYPRADVRGVAGTHCAGLAIRTRGH